MSESHQPAPFSRTRILVSRIFVGAALLTGFLPTAGAAPGSALVIDHSCTDIKNIPPEFVEKAKAELKVAYGHTSHGSQIVSGMQALARSNPVFAFGPGGRNTLSLLDTTPEGDLGNPDRTTWARRTRDFLNGPGKDRNVVLWSWCGQAGSASEKDIQGYLKLMSDLEADFPRVTFVYMTGHLDGTGKDGNLNKRNEQIRAFCRANGKTLFDFADIESFSPRGKVNFMELGANDNCDYNEADTQKNWAAEWLAKNPSHDFSIPSSAAHTHPLNGALKGAAFWWMLARIAGWNGSPL